MCEVISSQSSGVKSLLKRSEGRAGDGRARPHGLGLSQEEQHRRPGPAVPLESLSRAPHPGPM